MFPINFDKRKAEHFIRCLGEGEPIGVVHTVKDMVGLAGACFFGIMSHGPILRKMAAQMQGKELDEAQPREHKEADEEMVLADLHTAIEFVGQLTTLVCDGQYDDKFEDLVKCLVTGAGGKSELTPVQGFKPEGLDFFGG